MRAVVIGGYGNFGAAIAAKLAGERICEVVVAGRDASRARRFAASIGSEAARLDAQDADLAQRLSALRAAVVISTAGPFQGQDYRVARAALAAGAHYIDIADGRDFVCGITRIDAEARAAGRLAVSGASSVPALSAAVADRYRHEFSRLDAIEVGISTAQRAPGLATTRGVLGYAGKPIVVWREGAAGRAHGWQGLRSRRFRAPVGRRWLCDCDVPELELFPARYPGVRSVRFGAGAEFALAQWGVWGLAGMVRAGVLSSLDGWAAALHAFAARMARFSSGRSAMFVELVGLGDGGSPHRRIWELVATGGHGARIPAMAAVALTRKLAAGAAFRPAAQPCLGLVDLDAWLAELAGLEVTTYSSRSPFGTRPDGVPEVY